MDALEEKLKLYLDIGVDDEEIHTIVLAATANRLRDLKLAIGSVLLGHSEAMALDNSAGAQSSLKQAKDLKKQYHHCFGVWRRLGGEDAQTS